MARFIPELLEFIGLTGILSLIAFIPWTKMLLGACLTLIGAFFPNFKSKTESGSGNINFGKFKAALKGTCRFGVVVGGLVLLVGAITDGHTLWKKDYETEHKNEALDAIAPQYTQLQNEMQQLENIEQKLNTNQPSSLSPAPAPKEQPSLQALLATQHSQIQSQLNALQKEEDLLNKSAQDSKSTLAMTASSATNGINAPAK